jgi:hypothetical protein
LTRFLPDSRIGVWVVGDFSESPQSFRAVASGQSGIVIFVIHCGLGFRLTPFAGTHRSLDSPSSFGLYFSIHSSRLKSLGIRAKQRGRGKPFGIASSYSSS